MSEPIRRRWWAFSLRELLLLMLTVAAIAGWWRNIATIRSRLQPTPLVQGSFISKLVNEEVEAHSKKVSANAIVRPPSATHGGGGSSARGKLSSEFEFEIDYDNLQTPEAPLKFGERRRRCNTLLDAVVQRLTREIEAIPGAVIEESDGGPNNDLRCDFSCMIAFARGRSFGVVHVRVEEPYIIDPLLLPEMSNGGKEETGPVLVRIEIQVIESAFDTPQFQ